MKLIVGLGNPGREYHGTRHNVGFEVIDALAKRHRIQVRSRRGKALIGTGSIEGEPVILAKPTTFMNLSGQAVGDLARRHRLNAEDIVVICDDVNLPLGKLRIRAKGSAGGHNGLKSIIHSLGTQDFPRVRVGIGTPRRDMVDHVLSRFARAERPAVQESVEAAANAVEAILKSGIEAAMNSFNASPSAQT
ncbi:MAG: aminoacyl-tRNA hydrolase [Armatimonadota bacterium]